MSVLLFFFVLVCSIAKSLSIFQVTELPGLDLDGTLPFAFETGYVNIDETNGIELFYYFIKSERNPVEDPLLIWFSGGPGCSGLKPLLIGNGPLLLKLEEYNGYLPRLELNPYGWTKVSNVLYVDSPVGTGFSYSTTVEGSYSNDTLSAKQSYTFIRKWLMDHTEFLSNPVIIGADSYTGMVVPIIVQNIAEGIEAGDKPLINLKGYLLGNPMTFPDRERYFAISFVHGIGLISNELHESVRRSCYGDYINEFQCDKDWDGVDECLSGIWPYNILLPKCEDVEVEAMSSGWRLSAQSRNLATSLCSPLPSMECLTTYGYLLSYYWANNGRVQEALNVRKGKVKTWHRCNHHINYTQSLVSRVPYHANLSKRGIRSLIYSGDHDLVVPFMSTEEWIRSLNYSITDEWRPWLVDMQVSGYTRTYANNMTYATIKGGSHVPMQTHPKGCLAMYKRWISYESL